jgi:hypothetical protein
MRYRHKNTVPGKQGKWEYSERRAPPPALLSPAASSLLARIANNFLPDADILKNDPPMLWLLLHEITALLVQTIPVCLFVFSKEISGGLKFGCTLHLHQIRWPL